MAYRRSGKHPGRCWRRGVRCGLPPAGPAGGLAGCAGAGARAAVRGGAVDRQAAGQVRARMDWKFLLGLELDDPGFDFTVLGEFRSRLIGHGLEERVLAAVLARLSGAGLLRAGRRQRTDSTHVLAAVRTLNRMEFAGETLRAALEALAAAAPGWLAPLIDSAWADRYGARIGTYRFPRGEDTRRQWAEQAGRTASRCWTPLARRRPRNGCGRSRRSRPCAAPGASSTTGTGRGCAGGKATTSRQAGSGWPLLMTSTPATASSAGPAGWVTRST